MLATPWPAPFSDDDWWFEPKWDGIRAQLLWDGTSASLWSRRGNLITATYPELLTPEVSRPAALDGEIVAFGSDGVPSFELLQKRMNLRDEARARRAAGETPVTFVAFDLLHDGESVTFAPVEERRARLRELDLSLPFVTTEPVVGDGLSLWDAVVEKGLEGLVAKRIGSPYRPGVRSPDWRKVVHVRALRAVVIGFSPGEGGRVGTFGSLILGLWDDGRLRWVGNVGTGFSDQDLVAIRSSLDQMAADGSLVADAAAVPGPVTWVEPVLVARVGYREWTDAARLRAPRFQGFTDDAADVVTWQAEGPDSAS